MQVVYFFIIKLGQKVTDRKLISAFRGRDLLAAEMTKQQKTSISFCSFLFLDKNTNIFNELHDH